MPEAIWQPHPGSQQAVLECPYWLVLYHGTRGPGKTDALVMDYGQHVGQGFGPSWRGVLFRKTYKQLSDVVARTKRWFPRIFPGCKYNGSEFTWTFADGEQLLLRYMSREADYWEYHGHEYPWIGWEELTRWPTSVCYEMMKACSRSSLPEMPRKIRATANPYGIGHAWVKREFINRGAEYEKVVAAEDDEWELYQTHIAGDVTENKHLMEAQPEYVAQLDSITDDNLRAAWRHGDWDIVAGGALDDVWDRRTHVVKPFVIPRSWYLDRGHDWGSSSPFSVLWFAESDGSEFNPKTGGAPKKDSSVWYAAGTLFVVAEWYGGTEDEKGIRMPPRDIARGVVSREADMAGTFAPGPADTNIFDDDPRGGSSMADDMSDEGVDWERAIKSPGSRIRGLEMIRQRFSACKKKPFESPGLFFFATCKRLIEHIPVLERDEKNIHDVNTDQPDHDYDNLRYRVLAGGRSVSVQEI